MLTLPHDALSEIALRLPAVKSTKPWSDMNSLATTCKGLYQWKKTKIDQDVRSEWKRVSAEVAKTTGWRDSLEKTLSDFEDPSRRLFREPVLRKIAKVKEPKTTADSRTSIIDFNANLYINRETASLNEISWCLVVCADKKLEINKKIELVTKLPSFLSTLKSTDRQTALRMMFKLFDTDKVLGMLLKYRDSGIFKKIESSLDDDEPSEALLELGLRTRGLLTSKTNLMMLGFNLECIPSAERWNWVSKNVPECLNTTLGMQAMLNDSVCRPQMINHLYKSFNWYSTPESRLELYEKISPLYSKLCECSDGKKLAKKISHWFLREKSFTTDQGYRLPSTYMDLLINHIGLVKICFGSKEKKLLKAAICRTIQYANETRAYDQSASLLIALAKDDAKLLKNLYIGSVPRAALKHALAHAKSIENLDIRYSYVSALYKAASFYRKVDPEFVDEFYTELESIKFKM
jgi:hypothetical protein